jgi:hypothetical protein
MKRRVRAVPFARRRSESLIRNIAALPMAEWPKHLLLGRDILIDELALDDESARAVLINSYCAGHVCAQEIDQRSRDIADFAGRLKLRKIFLRISRCARRSPTPLRHALDSSVRSTIDHTTVDAESIEALIEDLIAAFARFPEEAPSFTVLRVITPRSSLPEGDKLESLRHLRRRFSEACDRLQQDYSALRALDQIKIESALTALRTDNAEFKAADVCESISVALEGDKGLKATIHDLITDYVLTIALVWVKHGLKPYRSTRESKANYRGKFHRFADLILTGAVEPWSKRHDGNYQEFLARLRESHAQLPSELRKFLSPAPRRSDVEWLVSDDHVKVALTRLKKRPPKLHTRSSGVRK